MMERLDRFVPPGMTALRIKVATVTAIVLSLLFSLGFLASYHQELAELKRQMEYPVFHGLTITPFRDLIIFPMIAFHISVLLPLTHVPGLYGYFYQDSKSIYLMKRLNNPMELHLRCLVLPLGAMVLTAAIGMIVYWLYYLIYMTCTPEILLPANL